MINMIEEAVAIINDAEPSPRRHLVGTERQIAYWKTIFGNSVDYHLSQPLPTAEFISKQCPFCKSVDPIEGLMPSDPAYMICSVCREEYAWQGISPTANDESEKQ